MNLLFVCSRNKWRSPTAEVIFKKGPLHNVKSAGTERAARIRVTGKLILWADLIFVMEKHHKERLMENFKAILDNKRIIILDIPDEYKFMDEELIETLKSSVAPYLVI
jgi:predicted protein tyrosine phosphatase